MTRWIGTALTIGVLASTAVAQNQPSPEQLQTMYQDALNQLKAAQDRKNELATENQKLQKKQAQLEADLTEANRRLAMLRDEADQTRDQKLAWQDFISLYSPLRSLWADYVGARMARPQVIKLLGDGNWPFTIDD